MDEKAVANLASQLRTELDSARTRLAEMEQQMSLFSARLEDNTEKEAAAKGNVRLHGSFGPANGVNSIPLAKAAPGSTVASAANLPYVDAHGQITPDSTSATSLSMTPDSFSPFQRMHPAFAKSHGLMNPADVTYAANLGYAMRQSGPGLRGQGGSETNLRAMALSAVRTPLEVRKGNFTRSSILTFARNQPLQPHGRPERSTRTALQELQVPVELLIAKTLGARSQDASITLQQQLKTGTPARKAAIIEGMSSHVVRLSEDKHGNFLVQRASECKKGGKGGWGGRMCSTLLIKFLPV